jgi:Ca-activated chloride channel family protein
MDRSIASAADSRRWSEIFGQRPEVPSWLISMILHAAILVALTLTLPLATRTGAAPERIADVGIVLKHQDGEGEYYETQGDAGQDPVTSATHQAAGISGLDAVLPTEAPVDPTTSLPEALNIIGTSAGGGGIPSAGGAADGPGGNTRSFGGEGQTSVFGVPGKGYKFAYVFDRSASMGGSGRNALSAAQAELIKSLESLQSTHQFMIIFYNEYQEVFNPSGQAGKLPFATKQNKQRAARFIRGITASGSTRHEEAILAAIKTRPDVIFFLTDADEPRLSANQLYKLQRRASGITINAIEFGLGPESGGVNFLQQLAHQNGGRYRYVDITRLLPTR